MGTKYTIEVEDKPFELLSEDGFTSEKLFRVKGFNSLVFDWNGLQMLTPYTEDSAYAHGYTEAESKYREIRDELEKQAYERGYKESYDTAYADAEEIYESGKRAMYQKGLKDAWWYMQKILLPSWLGGYGGDVIREIFEIEENHNIEEAVLNYSASEAIEKIRQYEQRQEEQITKGDIVLIKSTPEVEILVTYADEEYVSGIALTEVDGNCEIGDQYTNIRISNVEKAGKHYDIVSVLQKMKETDNG